MKLVRRFFLALSLLFVIRLYLGGYDELITFEVKKLLAEQHVPCEVTTVTVRPVFRPTIGRLECRLGAGDPAILHELELRFLWLDLVLLRPGLAVTWLQYDGTFSVTLHRSIRDGHSDIDLSVTKASVGQLPQYGPVGVEGQLSSVMAVHLDSAGKTVGEGKIHIEDLSVAAKKSKLSLLPEVRAGDLFGTISMSGPNIKVKPLDMSSPYGQMNAEMNVAIESASSVAYNGSAILQLNDQGVKKIGGFLALAAQKDVSHPAEEWLIGVSGRVGGMPIFDIRPKGPERSSDSPESGR